MALLERLTELAGRHPILSTIPAELTRRRGVHRCLTPGELLYRSGDAADGIYFLLVGALQIEYPNRGAVRGRAITIVLAPGVLGECQTIYRRSWSGTGVALTELDVITFDRAALFDLLARDPSTAKALYCELAWQFLGAIDRRRVEPVLEPEDQIRNYLHDLRTVFATPGDPHPWLPVTQNDLARACALRRETVVRLLTRWREADRIESRRGQIRMKPRFARRRPRHLVSIISRAHDPADA
jgi:CRP-like cAMP-binding protein